MLLKKWWISSNTCYDYKGVWFTIFIIFINAECSSQIHWIQMTQNKKYLVTANSVTMIFWVFVSVSRHASEQYLWYLYVTESEIGLLYLDTYPTRHLRRVSGVHLTTRGLLISRLRGIFVFLSCHCQDSRHVGQGISWGQEWGQWWVPTRDMSRYHWSKLQKRAPPLPTTNINKLSDKTREGSLQNSTRWKTEQLRMGNWIRGMFNWTAIPA